MDPSLLGDFVTTAATNWALLTPLIAQLLSPQNARSLRTLVIGGDSLTAKVAAPWLAAGVTVVNAYGPTEACVLISANNVQDAKSAPSIGRGVGFRTWVVDQEDCTKLVPVGQVGELLSQGPSLADGYLNDVDKSNAAFIPAPAWALRGKTSLAGVRAYRTGDLVRYISDHGDLQYVGRRDTQVKLNGQRIELGDIEEHLRACLPDVSQIVVEIIGGAREPEGGNDMLAAFFCSNGTQVPIGAAEADILAELTPHDHEMLAKAVAHLESRLPSYMVPSLFIPLRVLPTTSSAKADRKLLHRLISDRTALDIREAYSIGSKDLENHEPETEMERLLQQLWAETLHLPSDSIGLNTHFIRAGGDSVSAMRLVGTAQQRGISLSVAAIFENPTLQAMAQTAKVVAVHELGDIAPFSLLPPAFGGVEALRLDAARLCSLMPEQVLDIYPVTALQEGIMSLSQQGDNAYVARNVFRLPPTMDVDKLKRACEVAYTNHAILRTRMVMLHDLTLQVVVDDELKWRSGTTLKSYVAQCKAEPMTFGAPLSRFGIVSTTTNETWFILTLHHAIYDGWSSKLLIDAVMSAYEAPGNIQTQAPSAPFNRFIKYLVEDCVEFASADFWRNQSAGFESFTFPQAPRRPSSTSQWARLRQELPLARHADADVTTNTLLRTAWALTLSVHADTSDVAFGATISGRNVPVPQIEMMVGPTFATVPVRVTMQGATPIQKLLSDVQRSSIDMVPHQQFGLLKTRDLSPDAQNLCSFKTLLVVQSSDQESLRGSEGSDFDQVLNVAAGEDDHDSIFRSYAITLECSMHGSGITVDAHYDTNSIAPEMMVMVLNHFRRAFINLSGEQRNTNRTVQESLDLFSGEDKRIIDKWATQTAVPPKQVDACLHELFHHQVLARPDEEAIRAWDMSVTYAELDDMSNLLAHYLISERGHSMGGSLIPFCMEKSGRALVVMLAIMKAGCGYVPLDPGHPIDRRAQIISDTGSSIVFVTPETVADFTGAAAPEASGGAKFIVVSHDFIKTLQCGDSVTLPATDPSAPAYTLFTSGSTGKPKGVVVSHRAACSALTAQARAFLMTPSTRAINFASFVFDASVLEIFGTWISGGCVAVPSDSIRLNGLVARFMTESQTDWALFTPTFATTLTPQDVPTLKVLVLGGEAIRKENVETWLSKVSLFNAYGPTEACVATVHHRILSSTDNGVIGKPVGCRVWVTRTDDYDKLAPVGCAGELIIEGPGLATGYLHDRVKTDDAFIRPSWLVHQSSDARAYRTGDIVRYTAHGDLEYLGRRDSQIKLRGQRLEAGEIEYQIKTALGASNHSGDAKSNRVTQAQVAVTALKDILAPGATELIAFIYFDPVAHDERQASAPLLTPMDEKLRHSVKKLIEALVHELPEYMVPTLFVPVVRLPLSTAGKADTRHLNGLIQELPRDDLLQYSISVITGGTQAKEPPENEMEATLQSLWSSVLSIPKEAIGRNGRFLNVGGDSVSAIRLVTAARGAGLNLSVSTIFQHPRLRDMAQACAAAQDEEGKLEATSVEPFSLLDHVTSMDTVVELARRSFQPPVQDPAQIVDAFPCTSLQEGMMALTDKEPGTYVARLPFRVGKHVDMAQFRAAWEAVVAATPILRTRIVSLANGRAIQVVLDEPPLWREYRDDAGLDLNSQLARYLEQDKNDDMRYGTALSRYAVLTSAKSAERLFVWTAHHAVYDGWSLDLIRGKFMEAYNGVNSAQIAQQSVSYANFVAHVETTRERGAEYWRNALKGARPVNFPRHNRTRANNTKAERTNASLKSQFEVDAFKNRQIRHDEGTIATKASFMRAAWALVVSAHAGGDGIGGEQDVVFGTTVSGRNAAVPGIEGIVGPAVTTVPLRVLVDPEMTVATYLEDIQSQSNDLIMCEQFGLQNIAKLGEDEKQACEFRTLLVVHPPELATNGSRATDSDEPLLSPHLQDDEDDAEKTFFTYPLVFQCHLPEDGGRIDITVTYSSSVVSSRQVEQILGHFKQAVKLLAEAAITTKGSSTTNSDHTLLSQLDIVGSEDIDQFAAWNQEDEPVIQSTCVHHLVEQQAQLRPGALAINAWDGQLTYGELNQIANRIAHLLYHKHNVRPESLVHVCFEKSVWYFVSILAINKAGGAWVPLDPSHPTTRHQQVTRQTKAKLVLTSPKNKSLMDGLIDTVLEITPELDQQLLADKNSSTRAQHSETGPPADVGPQNTVYVLFTSGSTGIPKGFVMEHGAVAISQRAIAKRLKMTPHVKMLQFAAFVFDLCIGEIIAPLITGATIYVPSEHDRMNRLPEYIRDMGINWAFLTPAFVRTIRPEQVPSLELVLLAGEAVGRDILDTWFGKVRLVNGWGPAETCVFSTLQEWTSLDESSITVGKPVGGYCWIVDAANPHRRVPAGCVGEIVIQGPTITREYLANPTMTNATIIAGDDLPSWAPRRADPHWNRFYKSGDLGFYNPDGTIEFCARKDTQVKIRGLRVELGEVEHHVRSCLEDAPQVVVILLNGDAGSNGASTSAKLVTFFCFSHDSKTAGVDLDSDLATVAEEMLLPISEDLRARLVSMTSQLSVSLPRYMVPTLFIPCRYMPFITSTKIDRNKLRDIAAQMSSEEMMAYSFVDSVKRPPETKIETLLQKIWAEILNIPTSSIGRDDSFIALGGDSIAAIRLTTIARDHGVEVTVGNVFNDPRLLKVAEVAVDLRNDSDSPSATWDHLAPQPWALLPQGFGEDDIEQAAKAQIALPHEPLIVDAYPCTALQEGLMALSVKQPGSYIARFSYQLGRDVSVGTFKEAWESVVRTCSNLRTRIIRLPHGGSVQVVLQSEAAWESTMEMTLHEYISSSRGTTMTYGSPLSRCALIEGVNNYFVWDIHHAVYDGWSMNLMMDLLHRTYGQSVGLIAPAQVTASPVSYASFIQYTMHLDQDAAAQYWRSQLNRATKASFPPQTRRSAESTTRTVVRSIAFSHPKDVGVVRATVIRAAWALVLAAYADHASDICFGATVSGRQAPVAGIEKIAGPLIATVPIRVRLDRRQLVSDFLMSIQRQATDMVNYEQYGLQRIARLSRGAKAATEFSTLLVIQPKHIVSADKSSDPENTTMKLINSDEDVVDGVSTIDNYFTYPLVVQGHLSDTDVQLHLIYDTGYLEETEMTTLAEQLENVVHQLVQFSAGDKTLAEVTLTGPVDIQKAVQWNSSGSRPMDVDLNGAASPTFRSHVEHQSMIRPNSPAVQSPDGTLTYAQLYSLSQALAGHLQRKGLVQQGDFVPLCLDQSFWMPVSMLAVHLLGAAFVLFDWQADISDAERIFKDVGARSVLCLRNNVPTDLANCGITVVELSGEILQQTQNICDASVTSSGVSHVLFPTSEDGEPAKGVVMEHLATCAAHLQLRDSLGLTSEDRVANLAASNSEVFVSEIMTTLMSGATLCIPATMYTSSEQDLSRYLDQADVSWAVLSAAQASGLHPSNVPKLHGIVVRATASLINLDNWTNASDTRRTLYALSTPESGFATLHQVASKLDEATLGRPLGLTRCWLVDPVNKQRLAPVGCVGELVIQGPTLAKEYLNSPDETSKAFLSAPVDTSAHGEAALHIPSDHRCFQTGIYAKYRPDGTIILVGQVQFGNSEHRIMEVAPKGIAQAIVARGKTGELTAFLALDNQAVPTKSSSNHADLFVEMSSLSDSLSSKLVDFIGDLETILPGHMLPHDFVLVRSNGIPLVASGSPCRSQLLQAMDALTDEQLLAVSVSKTVHSQDHPETLSNLEMQLADIWAQVLGVADARHIGRQDNFFKIGGDSISAIDLVSKARQRGISLTVAGIFANPRLVDMASAATFDNTAEAEPVPSHVPAFSLLSSSDDRDKGKAEVIAEASKQCKVSSAEIGDAFPCSSLQEGMLALAEKQRGSYMGRFVVRLPKKMDVDRFTSAMVVMVEQCPNLRTRIIMSPSQGRQIQVIINRPISWEQAPSHTSLAECLAAPVSHAAYGGPLSTYMMVHDEASDQTCIIWEIHHSIYDGWTLSHMIQVLHRAYEGQSPVSPRTPISFSKYVEHALSTSDEEIRSFWQSQLVDANTAKFPDTTQGSPADVRSDGVMTYSLRVPAEHRASGITTANLLRASWALVLDRYLNSDNESTDNVVFGATVSGRDASIPGILGILGPTIATVPVCVRFGDRRATTVGDYLVAVQDQTNAIVPYEHIGLHNISRVIGNADATAFHNLLIIQPRMGPQSGDSQGETENQRDIDIVDKTMDDNESYYTYPLVFQCVLGDDGDVSVTATFDSRSISQAQMEVLCRQFETAVRQLGDQSTTECVLSEVNLFTPEDFQIVQAWNCEPDRPFSADEGGEDSCLHHGVERWAFSEPNRPAVVSTAHGTLSYADLNRMSGQLAHHLQTQLGIGPETRVPVCMEKTPLAIVAILAIMKAGATFVPLEPSHPIERRRAIISQVGARLLLVSPSLAEECRGMAEAVVEIEPALFSIHSTVQTLPHVSPQSTAYILYTSGSTGTPKGIVVPHAAACTSVRGSASSEGYNLNPMSRVLQFSSFVFDVSIAEIFGAFMFGSTLVMPSNPERLSDISAFIQVNKVNTAMFTTSFAKTLEPDNVASLSTLVLVGEPPTRESLTKWIGRVDRLVNAYGPSETVMFCGTHVFTSETEMPSTIGRGVPHVGITCWITEIDNTQRLAPLGCIGEIVVHSGSLSSGYLNDEARTTAAFFHGVPWLTPTPKDRQLQDSYSWYQTGDLGRYNLETGMIEYLGRRDTQVKLRGQRLETAETEHHVKRLLPGVEHAAVDVVKRDGREMLAAFIGFVHHSTHAIDTDEKEPAFAPITDSLRTALVGVTEGLKQVLPIYMVPTLFVPVTRMPFNNSLKLDRRKLQHMVEQVATQDLLAFSVAAGQGSNAVNIPPATPTECVLQAIWAQVLGIEEQTIGREDTFNQHGGDSIATIQLVSVANQHGVNITAAEVFQHPRLQEMAACVDAKSDDPAPADQNLKPFALLSDISPRATIVQEVSRQCDTPESSISDAFPCTPLQQGLIALAEKQPGSYVARFALHLPVHVDMDRFQLAMEGMYQDCSNLRTRIVLLEYDELVQVVVDEDLPWTEIHGQEPTLEGVLQNRTDLQWSAGFGQRLCRFFLVHDGSGFSHLVWDIHHSIYDGWSIGLMLDLAQKRYNQDSAVKKPISFAHYVKYIMAASAEPSSAKSYWQSRFANVNISHFPNASNDNEVDSSDQEATTDATMKHELSWSTQHALPNGVTLPTILRSAWALVLSRYTDSNDVVFGNTVTGRNASVPGIVNIVGPTIGTLPVRVRIHDNEQADATVHQFLERMQQESNDMVPFEHVGLQTIAQMGKELREACNFQNLLVIQPGGRRGASETKSTFEEVNFFDIDDLTSSSSGNSQRYHVYPLVFQCIIESTNSVRLLATYDTRSLPMATMEAICHHFSQAATQLVGAASSTHTIPLSSIALTSKYDVEKVLGWTSDPSRIIRPWDACVHDLVSQQARSNPPNKEAIYAWDGTMTYAELDQVSSQLAAHLQQLGVGPEVFVPICFEKSMWTIVAMLGIMKAGGAFVPLDPAHPPARREALVQDIGGVRLILASPSTAPSCANIPAEVMVLSPALISQLPSTSTTQDALSPSPVTSRSAAYAIFTSGSTGKPKGVVMEHYSLCSSIRGHATDIGLNAESRVLQFSNYVFDVSLGEILSTLVFGGTVCVPSDTQRLSGGELPSFMAQSRANVAMFTPSVVSILSPSDVPTLKTLVLGGEAPTRDNLQTWGEHVKLVNGYGPAEACIYCSAFEMPKSTPYPNVVGRGSNFNLWVVDVDDPTRLAPIGCTGEILLEGPGLARGYLNNKEATSRAFIELEEADWFDQEPGQIRRRFYKTGDLARYTTDGTVQYLGRKDTQVKLHGQRIELGEIEHQVKKMASSRGLAEHVVVDIVQKDGQPTLAAIVSLAAVGNGLNGTIPVMMMMMTDALRVKFSSLAADVGAVLPRYMVPQYFILASHLPATASSKIDRTTLRGRVNELSSADLRAYYIEPSGDTSTQVGSSVAPKEPSNDLERELQKVWARVLNLSPDVIGIDDSFYRLGGDSIRVITMAKRVKEEFGVSLGLGQVTGQGTTIARLAIAIEAALTASTSSSPTIATPEDNVHVDLQSEIATLTATLTNNATQSLPEAMVSVATPATVFLTGATGFLGTEILRQLLFSSSVARVIALVRARSEKEGVERIEKTARTIGWWSGVGAVEQEKLEVWTGDLSAPRLGLGSAKWEQLVSSVDAIIHNGAVVNWQADFETLRAVNVSSTVDLLSAAMANNSRSKLVYVSGGIKLVDTQEDQSGVAAELSRGGTGYMQTKFLAESLVNNTAAHLTRQSSLSHGQQNRVSVVKPGVILGAGAHGAANVDDYLWRVVASAAAVNAYPSEPDDHWLYLDDTASVARSIISQLELDVPTSSTLASFVDLQRGMTVSAFWDLVDAALATTASGRQPDAGLKSLSWDEWTRIALAQMEGVGEQHPLWPVQDFLGMLGTGHSPADSALRSDGELEDVVRRNVRYLVEQEFIGGAVNGSKGGAFRRTALNPKSEEK
ncbi:NRPS [Purpureocillium takamizusanense]|uniref:NRPS n=1 Tax=Purpureocillium takamizusanense TaxID=2060973 RepID=A0A9Q8V7V6_9HYPO|nr:NRPS [Purpureocillium takamizusanense]UNI16430.1 NRPS [Purpureocillium takamizusanense]